MKKRTIVFLLMILVLMLSGCGRLGDRIEATQEPVESTLPQQEEEPMLPESAEVPEGLYDTAAIMELAQYAEFEEAAEYAELAEVAELAELQELEELEELIELSELDELMGGEGN